MQILWVTFWEGDFPPKNLCIEVWGLVMFMIRPPVTRKSWYPPAGGSLRIIDPTPLLGCVFFVFLVSGGQGGGDLAGPSRMKPLGGNLQKSWFIGYYTPPWKSDIDTKTNLRLQIWTSILDMLVSSNIGYPC